MNLSIISFFLGWGLLLSFDVSAQIDFGSALRLKNETFEEIIDRLEQTDADKASRMAPHSRVGTRRPKTVLEMRHSLRREIDLRWIPEYKSESEVNEAFTRIRDLRFLEGSRDKDFLRRISWLYPRDGCWVRAEVAVRTLEQEWKYPRPGKLFVFGNLQVKNPYLRRGAIRWWYHTAPAVRVGQEIFLLDPSLNLHAPSRLDDWLSYMSPHVSALQVAVCHPHSTVPRQACEPKKEAAEKHVFDTQKWYLDKEWQNLIWLRRDPKKELGDSPPW